MAHVNLGKARVDALLKVLDVEGAVRRDGSRWTLVPGSGWEYDGERYANVTALRRREQEAMAAFGADGRCLMRVLQEELDDPAPSDCGRCAVCAGPRWDGPLEPELVREAALLLRSRPIELEVKKMAPDEDGAMRKIPDDVRSAEGRALARLGDGGWDGAVQAGRREGRFDDELVGAAAEVVRAWGVPVTWVAAIPSRRSGSLVPDFAARLASALGLRFADVIAVAHDGPPQREMANAAQQVANVRGRFAISGDVPEGACLLVDDIRFSGWTLAMVAGQLRRRGSGPVHPLALTSAF
jgi:ATP-dependent DNA helicase RecQ